MRGLGGGRENEEGVQKNIKLIRKLSKVGLNFN